jgi:YaiO family outer membrane protein
MWVAPALACLAALDGGATACTAQPVAGSAAALGVPRAEWAAGGSVGRVSTGGPDWSALNGELLLRSDMGADEQGGGHPRVLVFDVQRAERFGQRDGQLGAATSIPIGRRWTAELATSGSASNRFLPAWSVDGGVSRTLGAGWVAAGRLRYREYRESIVDAGALSLDKYLGLFRAQYEVTASRVHDAATTVGHHVVADCFYSADPRDRMRASFAFGEEVESVGATGVVTTSVRDASVYWQQHVTRRWAIESGFGVSDHGSLYTRTEIQLGVRCAL